MKLKGKVAVITGGSSGIGLASALSFLCEGARVVIAARDETRGCKALEELQQTGSQAIFVPCDVTKAIDCENLVSKTINTFGRLDVLFNNAGLIYVGRTVVNTSEEEWHATMDVNVTGTYLLSKYAIPRMVEGGGGSIINNSSIYGLVGGYGNAAYCAAKGAIVLLTKAMALDHAAQNIRVNCICPGSVDTPMLREEMKDLGGVDLMWSRFAAKHPINRISSVDEVARAVLFLACDDSSFITGISLPVDGGRSAW